MVGSGKYRGGKWTIVWALSAFFLLVTTRASLASDSDITETRLPDGLTVLTKETHSAHVACTYVWYRVGSRNEKPGITGISHQLEHMMFKGTRKAFPNPGYIDLLIGRHGGENNAETDTDTTSYYLNIPSDQLDLALRIEADRMTQAAIDPAQLKAEKTVVLSEMEGDENDNSYFLSEALQAVAYTYHPYHYPIIGTKWDVRHFQRDQVYDYYRQHYAPNNAVLVVVGDFETKKLLARIRELWKDVRPVALPVALINPEPPQRGERRVLVRRAGTTAYLEMAFHIPAANDPDIPALKVLEAILTSGRSSRLYRSLVETQLATAVSADTAEDMDPGLFTIFASARNGVAPEKIELALRDELTRLRNEPVEAKELQKAKNQARAGFIYGQASVSSQAARIGFYQAVTGDWHHLTTFVPHIASVTAADVQRVANRYLIDDNRSIGIFTPNGEKPVTDSDSGGGSRSAHFRTTVARLRGEIRHSGLSEGLLSRSVPNESTASALRGATRKATRLRPIAPGSERGVGGDAGTTVKQRRLANGLTVIVRENHANPMVSIGGFVRAGSVNDPPGKYGVANLVAEMVTRGTDSRSSQQIAAETDFVGANLGLSASRERTDIEAVMLKEDFASLLRLFADVMEHPNFPEEELEKVRGETLTALHEQEDDTAAVATKRLYEALYPAESPFQHITMGRAEDIAQISRADLMAFYKQAYRPERTTLIIVGDVDAATAFAQVEEAFGAWKPEGEALPDYRPEAQKHSASSVPIAITVAEKSQDDIAMGMLGVSRRSPDYEAAILMNLILGGDEFVGRVGKRVRDQEGLAYYAYTDFVTALETAPWMFRAGVNPTNVPKAIASTLDEVRKMAAKGVTAAELEWAKDNTIGSMQLSLETNAGMVTALADAAFYDLGLDYIDRFPRSVRQISKAQVDAAARKYLHPEALRIVVAGPPVVGLRSAASVPLP